MVMLKSKRQKLPFRVRRWFFVWTMLPKRKVELKVVVLPLPISLPQKGSGTWLSFHQAMAILVGFSWEQAFDCCVGKTCERLKSLGRSSDTKDEWSGRSELLKLSWEVSKKLSVKKQSPKKSCRNHFTSKGS